MREFKQGYEPEQLKDQKTALSAWRQPTTWTAKV